VIRLLLALLLLAACGPASARELKIATWNMEWLTLRPAGDPVLPPELTPKRPEDRALLRRYALALDADVVALQEVDGPEAAAEVFPPDRYALYFTRDQVVQRVGFAVRRGIKVQQNPDLVALDVEPFARFRLRSGADITLDFPGDLPGGRLRLLDVHLKTGCQDARLSNTGRTCDLLRRQVAPLQGWITQRREEGVPFLLMGDFNRRMDGRDELLANLNQAAPLLRTTEGRANPCWGGAGFIDHILAGGAARGWVEPNSLRVMVYRESAEARERLSDHCPVSVRLQLPG
jgi:endonuclease/exonuclease/phosphatase family metal-dependent hydrolase